MAEADRLGQGNYINHYSPEELAAISANFEAVTNGRFRGIHRFEADLMDYIKVQSGVLGLMCDQNLGLDLKVANFLVGRAPTLAIVGSSANGKSLIATDIRAAFEIYQQIIPRGEQLFFLPWDRARKDMYSATRERAQVDPNARLPDGVAHPSVTGMISQGMRSVAKTVRDDFQSARLLIEMPAFRQRGEAALNGLRQQGERLQVLAMHSPETRELVLAKNERDVVTSASKTAVQQMQEEMLRIQLGGIVYQFDRGREVAITGAFLSNLFIDEAEGMIVRWNPWADINRFEKTRADFSTRATQPDSLSPHSVGALIGGYFDYKISSLPPWELATHFSRTIA